MVDDAWKLLYTVAADNERVFEESPDDGWVSFWIAPNNNAAELVIQYTDTEGNVQDHRYLLIPQLPGAANA